MHIQCVYNLGPLTGVFDSMMQSWIYTLELLREIFKSTAGCVIVLSEMKSHDESNLQDPSFTYRAIFHYRHFVACYCICVKKDMSYV